MYTGGGKDYMPGTVRDLNHEGHANDRLTKITPDDGACLALDPCHLLYVGN